MQRLSSVSMRTAAARAVSGGAPRAHRVAHAPLALQARVARPALTLIASSERHQACRSLCTTKVTGDGSHSDFAAQSKVAPDQELRSFLDKAVKEHDVLLFMKGTPAAPKCGFSAQVVRALQNEGVDFSSADVLSSDDIRQGIKDYSYVALSPCAVLGLLLPLPLPLQLPAAGPRAIRDWIMEDRKQQGTDSSASFHRTCFSTQGLAHCSAALRFGRVRWRLRHHQCVVVVVLLARFLPQAY